MKLLLNLALLGASVWSGDALNKTATATGWTGTTAAIKEAAVVPVATKAPEKQYYEIAAAIAKGDYETLNVLLDDVMNSTENGVHGTLMPRAGFVTGWQGINHPVLDSTASTLEIGVVSSESTPAPDATVLHTALSSAGEFVVSEIPVKAVVDDVGNIVWYLDIQSAVAAGVGVLSVALSSTDVLLYPVLERLWPCKGKASSSCGTGDYACFVKAHAECVDGDEEASTFGRVTEYMNTKYPGSEVKFELLTSIGGDVDPAQIWWKAIVSKERLSGVPVVSWMDETGEVHPCEVGKELTAEEGGLVGVSFRVAADEVNVTASEGLLIVDGSTGKTDEKMDEELMMARSAWGAVTPVPSKFFLFFGWFFPDRTWEASGCFQVHDRWTGANAAGEVHPLDGISVRVSSSLVFGVFVSWSRATADQNGCYRIRKTFRGPFASSRRTVRVLVDFNNNVVRVANPFDVSLLLTWGYFVVRQTAQVNQVVNFGTGTFFGDSGVGPLLPVFLNEVRRRQALTFWALQRYQEALLIAGGPALAFNSKYIFAYPTVGGVALDVGVQMIMVGPDWWNLRTVLHEASHVWHYQHMTGSFFPSILVDLANGCNTHNCQETPAVGFLEGFAEFAANALLCGAIWNSWLCDGRDGGKSMVWLRDHPTCTQNPGNCFGQLPVQPGLTNVWRLIRNDDGNTHGLMLLIDDSFYRRNFQGATNSARGIANIIFGNILNPACLWYPDRMTLWQVMRGFLPAPGLPTFVNRWTGLLDFYARLRSIYEPNDFAAGWFEDRLRFLDPLTEQNPWQFCRDPCPNPAVWWDGTLKQGTYDTVNCVVELAPAGAFVQNNEYYTPHTMGCPAGSVASADPMCYVMTLEPSWAWRFTMAINGGTAVSSAYRFGSCPNGYPVLSVSPFLGTFCLVYTAPAGHTVQVRQGTQIWVSKSTACSSGTPNSIGCYMGRPPAGTNAFVWGTPQRWYYTPQ